MQVGEQLGPDRYLQVAYEDLVEKPLEVLTPDALGVATASTVKTLKVEAPAARQAGIKVKSVAELVEKLKNEAKVI